MVNLVRIFYYLIFYASQIVGCICSEFLFYFAHVNERINIINSSCKSFSKQLV